MHVHEGQKNVLVIISHCLLPSHLPVLSVAGSCMFVTATYNFQEGWMTAFCDPHPTPFTQPNPSLTPPPSIHQLWPAPSLYSWLSKAAAATYLALWLTALLPSALHCICAVFIASFTFAVIEFPSPCQICTVRAGVCIEGICEGCVREKQGVDWQAT